MTADSAEQLLQSTIRGSCSPTSRARMASSGRDLSRAPHRVRCGAAKSTTSNFCSHYRGYRRDRSGRCGSHRECNGLALAPEAKRPNPDRDDCGSCDDDADNSSTKCKFLTSFGCDRCPPRALSAFDECLFIRNRRGPTERFQSIVGHHPTGCRVRPQTWWDRSTLEPPLQSP